MNNVKGMLSVVMPAYNEEACIYKNLLETCDCVSTFCPTYEIILVNDGSPDHTFDEAMRARAVNPHIAFLDADLDLSPMHLQAFLEELLNEDADIVIGSKLHKDSQLIYPLKRKIMSYGYYLLLHILFHLDLKDTQTGVKLFRAAVIKPIAESLSTSGYAFDIEILARANQMGCRILEMPIHLEYRRGMENGTARIRIGDVFSMFFDTLRIFRDIHFRS